MADSENGRTLSRFTRRGFRSDTKVWRTAQNLSLAAKAVFALCRRWFTAYGKQPCRARKRLEGRLGAAAQSPLVKVPEPDDKRGLAALTEGNLNALLGESAETADAPLKAKNLPSCPASRCGRRWTSLVALSPTSSQGLMPFSSPIVQSSITA